MILLILDRPNNQPGWEMKTKHGTWQNWGTWEDYYEAKETLEFHAQGREIEIIPADEEIEEE